MDSNPTSSGRSAAYGYSCANCAQSKRKCILRAGGPCQRCHKTNRECTPAKTVRRRGVGKKHVTTSSSQAKSSRLEEKIDSLVSLMKAGGQSGAASRINDSADASNVAVRLEDDLTSSNYGSTPICLNGDTTNTTTTDSIRSTDISALSTSEAEECLHHFLTFKLQYFPFVHIPPETRAAQLRKERPFLWLCVMAISTKSMARQHELGLKIRQIVAQEMVVQSDQNIDLLLGLLTFIGWASYQFHQFHPKPFLSVFTHLAISLIFDLGLNKSVQVTPSTFNLHQCPRPATSRTMEERRAALSCYLITSIISSFLQRMETFRWTPHLDESLQTLDQQKQCPKDAILVQLVRMRLTVEKGRNHRDAPEGTTHRDNAALFSDIKDEILKSSPQDVILLHLYSNELETTISTLSFTPSDAAHHNHLTQALTSTTSYFDILLTTPPAEYIGFTFAIFSQVSRCLLVLYRLATLDAPNWDKRHVRRTANPLSILDRLVGALEQVPDTVGIDRRGYAGGDLFSRAALILRAQRPEWEVMLGDGVGGDWDGPGAWFWGDEGLFDGWFLILVACWGCVWGRILWLMYMVG